MAGRKSAVAKWLINMKKRDIHEKGRSVEEKALLSQRTRGD